MKLLIEKRDGKRTVIIRAEGIANNNDAVKEAAKVLFRKEGRDVNFNEPAKESA